MFPGQLYISMCIASGENPLISFRTRLIAPQEIVGENWNVLRALTKRGKTMGTIFNRKTDLPQATIFDRFLQMLLAAATTRTSACRILVDPAVGIPFS